MQFTPVLQTLAGVAAIPQPVQTATVSGAESSASGTGKDEATIEGNGDGNGQVPLGQTEDEDGNIINNSGNMAPA